MKRRRTDLIAFSIFLMFNLVGYYSFAVNTTEKSLMDEARQNYENNKLDKAIELYQKIPQTSDFWLEALEEKSWTYLRQNKVNEALSTITTVTSDLLAPQIGPEPYLLKSMINYKLCNIKGVLEDFTFFKSRFQARSNEIEKLAASSSNKALDKALTILKANKNNLSGLKADHFGSDIQFLPRYFYRDREVLSYTVAGNEPAVINRISHLAKEENKEIESILQKMHLLESQIVQQVFAYNKEMQNIKGAKYTSTSKQNTLVFPYDSKNDIWLDEIDSFEAATSECPVDPFKGVKQ